MNPRNANRHDFMLRHRSVRRSLLALSVVAPFAIGCGGSISEASADSASPTAAAAAAPSAQLEVVGRHAGRHTLAATNAYFVKASDAYFDVYFTNQAMTSSSLAYGSALPDGAVLVIAPIESRDKTPIAAGSTFTFNSTANNRLTAVIKSAPNRTETFTIVDDVSLGTLQLTAMTADELRGEVQIEKDGSLVRGSFVARRLPG